MEYLCVVERLFKLSARRVVVFQVMANKYVHMLLHQGQFATGGCDG